MKLEGNKKGKSLSHRYNRLPLLPSRPGGVRQELVVSICQCKVKQNLTEDKNYLPSINTSYRAKAKMKLNAIY